jgi:hypothetical protein
MRGGAMNAPAENPGQVAWSLAVSAAQDVIERANVREPDIRRLATHALAVSFLPLTAQIVSEGGTTFDLVDETNESLDPFYAAWAEAVLATTIAAIQVREPQTQEIQ